MKNRKLQLLFISLLLNYGFSDCPANIQLISPDAGRTYSVGDTLRIGWTDTSSTDLLLNINLYKGGVPVETILYTAHTSINNYNYVIPNNTSPGNDYGVRVECDHNFGNDSEIFTITNYSCYDIVDHDYHTNYSTEIDCESANSAFVWISQNTNGCDATMSYTATNAENYAGYSANDSLYVTENDMDITWGVDPAEVSNSIGIYLYHRTEFSSNNNFYYKTWST